MHFLERGEQPHTFGSIWDSIYWSVITMTTVGYGDLVPVTPAGRALAGISSFVGVMILLLSASILAQAFVKHMEHFGTKCQHRGREPY